MKTTLVCTIFLFLSSFLSSQVRFEKGYIIDNQNRKFDCYIKNFDWKNNPESITYKLEKEDQPSKINVSEFKEFGIENECKFIKAKIEIDRSSNMTDKLSNNMRPDFAEEILLLKVLVDGKASLYSYQERNLTRYFFKVDNMDIEQLVYKKYLVNYSRIAENNQYQQQLTNNLKCGKQKDINLVAYTKGHFTKYFANFNLCNGTEYVVYGKKKLKNLINLSVKFGVNQSNFTFTEISSNGLFDLEYDPKTSFRFGASFEYFLPFGKNKWSLLLEAYYQKVNFSNPSNFQSDLEVSNSAIEVPFGVRYHKFFTENTELFLSALFVTDIFATTDVINSPIDLSGSSTIGNFGFGLGLQHKTISLEARYVFGKNFLKDFASYKTEYKGLSLILGVSLY